MLSIPLALIEPKDGSIIDCNQAFCQTLGLASPQLLGQNLNQILGLPQPLKFPSGWTRDAQRPTLRQEVNYERELGLGVCLELELIPWRQANHEYGLLQLRDLAAENQAEARHQAAEERTRAQDNALLQIASDESIHRGDLREALRTLTSLAAEVLGIDRVSVWQLQSKDNTLTCLCLSDTQLADFDEGESLRAQDFPRFFALLRTSRCLSFEKALEDHRTAELVESYLRPQQLQSLLYIPIRLGGKLIGVLGCEHRHEVRSWRPSELAFVAALGDLAALALSVQQHRQMENQLRHMMKMESVGRLAGGLAHDFNNLIQAINGYTLLLLEDQAMSEQNRVFLGEMKTASEMAQNLTHKLLAMSRKQPMKLATVSLNKMVADLRGILGKLVTEQCMIELELEPLLPVIQIDASLIEQVLINLVVNARDALPAGRGRIMIRTRSQCLHPTEALLTPEARPGNYHVISVADTGSGMDDATMVRLFEPFFTTKEEGKGTGLGLPIVYGIVKQHQGWIEVQSKPNQGSVFEVYLPVES